MSCIFYSLPTSVGRWLRRQHRRRRRRRRIEWRSSLSAFPLSFSRSSMSHLFALACLLSPLLLLTLRATYCSFLFLLLHFFCFEAPQRAQSTQPVFHATKLSSELESVREKTPAPSPLPLFRSGRRHYCQLYCCEHLTAFRLLSFVFCVSFLCIACCIFHTLQTAERETQRHHQAGGIDNGTCTTCTTACNRLKPPDLPSVACLPACLPPAPTQRPFSVDLARRPPSMCRATPQMSFRRRGRARRRRRSRNKSPPGWWNMQRKCNHYWFCGQPAHSSAPLHMPPATPLLPLLLCLWRATFTERKCDDISKAICN